MSAAPGLRLPRNCAYCGRRLQRFAIACYLHTDLLDPEIDERALAALAGGELELAPLDAVAKAGVKSSTVQGRPAETRERRSSSSRRDG